jgi:hypothetical protein
MTFTKECEAYVEAYLDEHLDGALEAGQPCQCFIDGWIAARRLPDYDDLDEGRKEGIDAVASDALSDFIFDQGYDDCLSAAFATFEAAGGVIEEEHPAALPLQ